MANESEATDRRVVEEGASADGGSADGGSADGGSASGRSASGSSASADGGSADGGSASGRIVERGRTGASGRTTRVKRSAAEIERDEKAHRILVALGAAIRTAGRRRRLTQRALASRTGLSQATISRMERGVGDGVPIATWIAVGRAVGLAPRFELGRDPLEATADAGHLAIQELLLRIGRATGYTGTFELPIRPADPRYSIDVCLRHQQARRLVLLEAWNSISDIGAGARSFDRKLASARELAAAVDGAPLTVMGAWIVRATSRNRELVARYPEVFTAKFPASSERWVTALRDGSEPPAEPGLVWCDLAATRLFAWRRTWRPS